MLGRAKGYTVIWGVQIVPVSGETQCVAFLPDASS